MDPAFALCAYLERLRRAHEHPSKDWLSRKKWSRSLSAALPSAKVLRAGARYPVVIARSTLLNSSERDTRGTLGVQHSALGSLFFLRPAASTPRGRGQAAPHERTRAGRDRPARAPADDDGRRFQRARRAPQRSVRTRSDQSAIALRRSQRARLRDGRRAPARRAKAR